MKHKHIYDASFIYTPSAKQEADYLLQKFRKMQEAIKEEQERVAKRDAEGDAKVAEIKPRIKGK